MASDAVSTPQVCVSNRWWLLFQCHCQWRCSCCTRYLTCCVSRASVVCSSSLSPYLRHLSLANVDFKPFAPCCLIHLWGLLLSVQEGLHSQSCSLQVRSWVQQVLWVDLQSLFSLLSHWQQQIGWIKSHNPNWRRSIHVAVCCGVYTTCSPHTWLWEY
jgi:hypothetical protein